MIRVGAEILRSGVRTTCAGLLPCAVAASLLLPAPAVAREETTAVEEIEEITPPVRRAVRRGLAWLAARQAADGSFGSGGELMDTQSAGGPRD